MRSKQVMTTIGGLILLAILAVPETRADQPPLTLTIQGATLTATGVSPGGTAIFFGAAHVAIPRAYMDRVQQWSTAVEDSDHDGVVTLTLPQNVPAISVWAVVDLSDSRYVIASGSGMGIRPMDLGSPLRRTSGAAVDGFVLNHGYMALLYVKPGLAPLSWIAMDGTSSDEDGPNGATAISLQKGKAVTLDGLLRPALPEGAQPVTFTPGGILIAIDLISIEIGTVNVDTYLIGRAQ